MNTNNEIIKIFEKFPDQNPNPVMRVSEEGRILYFNKPSIEIIQYWNQVKDKCVPKNIFKNLNDEKDFEIQTDKYHYLVRSVYVEELKSYNVYLQDITAKKIISTFPDQNPNPVMQVDYKGNLIYFNAASRSYIDHQELKIGDVVSKDLLSLGGEVAITSNSNSGQIKFGHITYNVKLVPV